MFGFFSSKINDFKEKVSKTAQALVGNLSDAVEGETEFSEFLLEDMEDDDWHAYYSLGYFDENGKFQEMWTWCDDWKMDLSL